MKFSKLVLLTLALAAAAWAQTAKTRYYTTTFYHVDGTKRAEYLEYRKNVASKILTALVKDDPKVLSYTIAELVYPGNPEPAWNEIHTMVTDGPYLRAEAFNDALYQRAAGVTRVETSTKLAGMRTSVGEVLSTEVARAGGPVKEGDFISLDYVKIAEGRTADYFASEAADWQPLYLQLMKDGVTKGYRLTRVRVPGGDRIYDAQYAHIWASLEAYLGRANSETVMRKIAPEKSFNTVLNRTVPTRHIVRTELRRVTFAASK